MAPGTICVFIFQGTDEYAARTNIMRAGCEEAQLLWELSTWPPVPPAGVIHLAPGTLIHLCPPRVLGLGFWLPGPRTPGAWSWLPWSDTVHSDKS